MEQTLKSETLLEEKRRAPSLPLIHSLSLSLSTVKSCLPETWHSVYMATPLTDSKEAEEEMKTMRQ